MIYSYACTSHQKNKTKIKVYDEHNLETPLAVRKQTRHKMTVKPDTHTVQGGIEHDINASIGKLTRLNAKLIATNRLIDLIVYRLSGLPDE